MFKNKKVLRTGALSLVAVVLLATGGYAAGKVYKRKVTATFGTISLEYEGKDITKDVESLYNTPAFVMESRSYVPVRAIGDVLGVDVDYDVVTKTAKISDPKKAEIEEKDGRIKNLEIENANLKKEIDKLKENIVTEGDLKALEKKLQNSYGNYKDLDFSIGLKEEGNNIKVEVSTDLKTGREKAYWTQMGISTKKAMIEDIAESIEKEFPKSDIKGRVYDYDSRRDLLSFTQKAGKKVQIFFDSIENIDRDLDRTVDREFAREGIKDARLDYVRERNGAIEIDVSFTKDYSSQWSKLERENNLNTLGAVLDSIALEAERAYGGYLDVYINVYMDKTIEADYDKSSNSTYGRVRLR